MRLRLPRELTSKINTMNYARAKVAGSKAADLTVNVNINTVIESMSQQEGQLVGLRNRKTKAEEPQVQVFIQGLQTGNLKVKRHAGDRTQHRRRSFRSTVKTICITSAQCQELFKSSSVSCSVTTLPKPPSDYFLERSVQI